MICKHCNKEVPEGSAFCPSCGKRVDGSDVVSDGNSKKKGILVGIIGVIVLACICGGVYINSTPEAKYKKAEKAFIEGNYESALKYYEAAGEYMDSADKKVLAERASHWAKGKAFIEEGNYAEAKTELEASYRYEDAIELIKCCDYNIGLGLLENGSLVDAASSFNVAGGYEDSQEKIFQIGKELITQEKFEDAVKVLSYNQDLESVHYANYAKGIVSLNNNKPSDAIKQFQDAKGVLDANERIKEATYSYAKEFMDGGKYLAAVNQFERIRSYKDTETMINSCNLMAVNDYLHSGDLNTAKETLLKLPEDFSYKDLSVPALMEKLNANSQWLNLCGRWTSTGGQMRVTQTGRSGYYNYWYYDFEEGDVNIDVRCKLNDDGTVTVETGGSLPIYTEYSSIAIGLKQGSRSLTSSNTMSSPSTVKIDDLTTLTLSGSKVTASYNKVENNRDVYFTYTYKSNSTCGKKIKDY